MCVNRLAKYYVSRAHSDYNKISLNINEYFGLKAVLCYKLLNFMIRSYNYLLKTN